MMFSCKHVSRLVSDSFERKLGFFERLQFKFHLIMCRICAHHQQDMECMRSMIKRRLDEDEGKENPDSEKLSPEARKRIQQVLESMK